MHNMKRYTSYTESIYEENEDKEDETLSDIDFLKRHFDKDKAKNGYRNEETIPVPENVLSRLLSDVGVSNSGQHRTYNSVDRLQDSSHSKTMDCKKCRSQQCRHLTESTLNSISHELSDLKQRDRSLLRRFIELRKTIQELNDQELHSSHKSLLSHTTSLFNVGHFHSMVSLNEETIVSPEQASLLKQEDYLGEYRHRTVSVSIVKHGPSPVVRKRFIYGDI